MKFHIKKKYIVTGLSPLEKYPESWELPQNASIDLSFRMAPFLLNLEHSYFLRFYGQGKTGIYHFTDI